ncbi:MAG: hypothetical protein ACM32O_03360 [Clostridia bacterium]
MKKIVWLKLTVVMFFLSLLLEFSFDVAMSWIDGFLRLFGLKDL